MDIDFNYRNLSCCSVELYWNVKRNKQNINVPYEYSLKQKDGLFSYKEIYQGDNTSYEVMDLKPKEEYTFRISIMESGKSIKSKTITVTLLNSPHAIISENSVKIANGEECNYINNLSKDKKGIINNCSKLIFEENNENIIKGDFDGIEIKIAKEVENNINYISFDIKPEEQENFFDTYIKEFENNIILPCHFIIPKLPTILIFNLLKEGPVILTGKRMGGVIASSLVFYIMYIGKSLNINYGNAFENNKNNCFGVVTFGSPSFLNNLTAAFKMKELTSYFYNIKHESDYIPEIIDFINSKQNKCLTKIFQKNELEKTEINRLYNYLKYNKITKDDLNNKINQNKKIPFGHYYKLKSSNFSLISINENLFMDFYYSKIFNSNNNSLSHLKVYKQLSSNIQFDKTNLEFLENKEHQIEFVRIIRRKIDSKSIKGIIKFKLTNFGNDTISPDIIKKIILIPNNNKKEYIINNSDIYYNNDIDITAYIDNLDENINNITIENNFGGKIKAKNIINAQGAGSNRKMLKDNIEKLFLFPFFKLFEIFYASLSNKDKYDKLKEENFGKNFADIKIKLLKSFQKQIQTLNELLLFSRPDILGNCEKEFIEEYTGGKLTKEQKENLNNLFTTFYKQALLIQQKQNINCLDSEINSIAKINNFPRTINIKNDKKKLFMCECSFNNSDNIISEKIDNSYIKPFTLEKLIIDTLQKIENDIKVNSSKLNDGQFKKYLNNNIGKFYGEKIISNIYFIFILILTSIEGGDLIKFNHSFNWTKVFYNLLPPFLIANFLFAPFGKMWVNCQNDFEKNYKEEEIEEIHMKSSFYKIKNKNIINSNISDNDNKKFGLFNFLNYFFINKKNKMYEFSEYSEKQKRGKEYYEKFLEILNNYSNDYQEDIQISIFDNLKEENKNKENNYLTIKDSMNLLIDDEESKKGFLALLRQSYLLGKLRNNIVRNNTF